MKDKKKIIVCLIGPTASGKTKVALRLARRIRAEIIACDSMQVYKGIKILSARPSPAEQRLVAHHLINIILPSRKFNAASFRTLAKKSIRDIHRRKKIPLIVAGTGLYLRALLDGLFPGPQADFGLRRKLNAQAERYGKGYLYRKLKKVDPAAAGLIHPHDLRRIIRALEVYKLCGRTISELKKQTRGIKDTYRVFIFGLQRQREDLYRRIDRRVERMFGQGAVEEIKALARRRLSQTAKSLLGYKEINAYLKGRYSCAMARELLKQNTRRYAKRQLSWFRHQQGIKRVKVSPGDNAKVIAEKIFSQLPALKL